MGTRSTILARSLIFHFEHQSSGYRFVSDCLAYSYEILQTNLAFKQKHVLITIIVAAAAYTNKRITLRICVYSYNTLDRP